MIDIDKLNFQLKRLFLTPPDAMFRAIDDGSVEMINTPIKQVANNLNKVIMAYQPHVSGKLYLYGGIVLSSLLQGKPYSPGLNIIELPDVRFRDKLLLVDSKDPLNTIPVACFLIPDMHESTTPVVSGGLASNWFNGIYGGHAHQGVEEVSAEHTTKVD